MINLGIAVNQNIAKGDDTAIFMNAGRRSRIDFGELVQRFADDLELTFDR